MYHSEYGRRLRSQSSGVTASSSTAPARRYTQHIAGDSQAEKSASAVVRASAMIDAGPSSSASMLSHSSRSQSNLAQAGYHGDGPSRKSLLSGLISPRKPPAYLANFAAVSSASDSTRGSKPSIERPRTPSKRNHIQADR